MLAGPERAEAVAAVPADVALRLLADALAADGLDEHAIRRATSPTSEPEYTKPTSDRRDGDNVLTVVEREFA
ncbi:MAG TPA: hypothetical protein VFH48_15405 [Chloroflexota bacterium]|nr:hypothetical protein [Chloroflexota bacterium]